MMEVLASDFFLVGATSSGSSFSLSSEQKPGQRLGKPGLRYTVPGAEPIESVQSSKNKKKKNPSKKLEANGSVKEPETNSNGQVKDSDRTSQATEGM